MLYYRLYKRLQAHFPVWTPNGVSPPFCYVLFTFIIPVVVWVTLASLVDRLWSPNEALLSFSLLPFIVGAMLYILLCEKYDKTL
jgi:hypothetical protein